MSDKLQTIVSKKLLIEAGSLIFTVWHNSDYWRTEENEEQFSLILQNLALLIGTLNKEYELSADSDS